MGMQNLGKRVQSAPEYKIVKETIEAYEAAREDYMNKYNVNDVRIMFFTKTINALYSYQLNRVLANGLITIPDDKTIQLLHDANLGQLTRNWQNFSGVHTMYCTFGCYTIIFNSFESTLRQLYKELGLEDSTKNFISLKEIYDYFIETYNLDVKYKSLLKLLSIIRNLMHNFGVSNINDNIEYNGINYEFKKDEFIIAQYADITFLLKLFKNDILDFINCLFKHLSISTLPFIPDNMSAHYCKQEEWLKQSKSNS